MLLTRAAAVARRAAPGNHGHAARRQPLDIMRASRARLGCRGEHLRSRVRRGGLAMSSCRAAPVVDRIGCRSDRRVLQPRAPARRDGLRVDDGAVQLRDVAAQSQRPISHSSIILLRACSRTPICRSCCKSSAHTWSPRTQSLRSVYAGRPRTSTEGRAQVSVRRRVSGHTTTSTTNTNRGHLRS